MNEKLSQEEALFCAAIEITDPALQGDYLQQQCGTDFELRRKIDRLLKMHQTEGKILDGTTLGDAKGEVETVSIPHTGQCIGPYKLLQEIGEGGMGVVFMAEQSEPVRRKVAVKIIKVGMDTRRIVARFESERQALALMDHPCITKVFDAGSTETGRPYFVMELVRGKSIVNYCDEKKLSLHKRLEIFEQVCQAVEHAHQKGIIHRDIKPSNIMVTSNDGIPLPKIIDFGIAKATGDRLTDKTLFTNYGEMIGTPLYMSPEQAEMSEPDVDTRSDIYSLGVLLYELLTGTTPFADLKKKSFHAIRDAIRSRDPQIASTRVANLGDTLQEAAQNRNTDAKSLHRFLRGDLDWILCKCLARQRSDRYQSAGEIAREIRRHLAGEPVEAAAPTLWYRAQKFTSRHRAAVSIAAALTFVLIGSSIFSTVMAVKANKMAKQANALAVKAQAAEGLANERLDQVIEQRDRIAELERRQRELAALNEAAANYNAQLLKKLGISRINPNMKTDDKSQQFKFEKVQKVYGDLASQNMFQTPPRRGTDNRMQLKGSQVNKKRKNMAMHQQQHIADQQPDHWQSQQQMAYVFPPPAQNDEVEIVLLPGQEDVCKTEFYKNVLQVQKQRFGKDDMIIVRTLAKIGQSLNSEAKFEESEKVLREALELLKRHGKTRAARHIRLHLAKSLSNQGKTKQAKDQMVVFENDGDVQELSLEVVEMMKDIKKEILELEKTRNAKPDIKSKK